MSAFLRRKLAEKLLRGVMRNHPELRRESDADKCTQDVVKSIRLLKVTKKTDISRGQFVLNFSDLRVQNSQLASLLQEQLNAEIRTDTEVNVSRLEGRQDALILKGDPQRIAEDVLHQVKQLSPDYGYKYSSDINTQNTPKGTVVVEYSSPNIAKPFHAGHLRSTIIGNFIANLYEKTGYKVIRLNFLGDWGTQFGLLAVGYQRYGNAEDLETDAMQHLFNVYVKVNQDVAREEESKNQVEQKTHKLGMEAYRKMEKGDPELLNLWQKFREMSIENYSKVYERLGVHFTEYHSESMYHKMSQGLIQRLKQENLLKFDQDTGIGYVEVDTVDDNQKKASILKSDGTSLYLTRDIAAALDRYERYKFDKIHYVVENGQHLHFQHLKGVLKKLEPWAANLDDDFHVKFGLVIGMSTRHGKVVFLKDILDEAKERMIETMKTKETTKETGNLEAVADILGVSAIIIQDLNQCRQNNYTFSWQRVLNFKADSGVFLQYAHSRLCSLERNCGIPLDITCDPVHLTSQEAQVLLLHIARYEDVIELALNSLEPVYIVQYLLQLCHLVNGAYVHFKVKDQSRDIAQANLQLFHASRITLANGLCLLGIQPLERM
ncbi:hypothetical protein ACJMK2_024973 [Sinanodonta woodiana]|uniref:Probable arginine--tRNA ligase, mitochondrial n=1 Tax=Sinanodonta woodiana TaxID=1069815 RepID=A0ABD3XIS4_SINWO